MDELRDFIAEAGAILRRGDPMSGLSAQAAPLQELVAQNRSQAIGLLIQLLQSGNGTYRKNAAFALGQIGDPVAIQPLIEQKGNESARGNIEAIDAALVTLRTIPLASTSSELERRRMVDDVYEGRSPRWRGPDKGVTGATPNFCISCGSRFSPDANFCTGCGKPIGEQSVGALIQALRSSDSESCRRAAQRAGDEPCEGSVPALIELLYRKDKAVIAAAAQALGNIGDLRAIQHLEECAYAQDFAGGIPGFDTLAEDGRIVEVAEEDALMEKALREAEERLWKRPGAGPYGDQLGKIRMHTFGDFWKSDNIHIDPNIQSQFVTQGAKRFFRNFTGDRFAFEGWVKAI